MEVMSRTRGRQAFMGLIRRPFFNVSLVHLIGVEVRVMTGEYR